MVSTAPLFIIPMLIRRLIILISLPSSAVTFQTSTVIVFNKVFWVVSCLKTSDDGHTDSLENFTY